MGTTSGGSLTMTRSPSTTVVNLSTAFIESFVRALAASLEAVAAMWASAFDPVAAACVSSRWMTSSTSTCEYQTSRLVMRAMARIVSR